VKFAVQSSRTALNTATQFWLSGDSAERLAITKAVAVVDQALSRNPGEEGESRDFGERVMFAAPLVINFTIDDANRVVRVEAVRQIKRRG
jgi:hypothetical protein